MSLGKDDEGAIDRNRGVDDRMSLLLRDWNESDEYESASEGEHVMPVPISTDAIVDVNGNKTSLTPESVAIDGIQPQAIDDDVDNQPLYGMPSPVFTRRKIEPPTVSVGHQYIPLPDGDGTNIVPDKDIDTAQNIDDERIHSKKRKEVESPYMVPPVKRNACLKSDKLSLDESVGGILDKNNPLLFTSGIQELEVAFDSTETIPPIHKVGDILERRMKKVDKSVVLRQFEYKTKMCMKYIRDHGLVHSGTRIGQVSWTILGEQDGELQGVMERKDDAMFQEEVGLGTREPARLRSSRRLSSKNETSKAVAVEGDVNEFHDNLVEYQVDDDDDFVNQDMKGDPDYEVKTEQSVKGRGKGKGKGKGKKDGKVGGGRGRGRGRGRERAEVEDNTKIDEFYSPVKGTHMVEGSTSVDEGNMSPLTASCNRPGLSGLGYMYSQEYYPLGSRSSPRSKSPRGKCPMCTQEFDMVLLERHAYICEG